MGPEKTGWRGSCAFTVDVYLASRASNRLNIHDADGSKRNYKFSFYAVGLSPLLQINGLMVVNRLYPHGSAQTELALVSREFWSQSRETSNWRRWQRACQAYKNVRSLWQTDKPLRWKGTNVAFLLLSCSQRALFISDVFIFIFIFNFTLHLPCQIPKITTIYDEPILWGEYSTDNKRQWSSHWSV